MWRLFILARSGVASEATGRLGSLLKSSEHSLWDSAGIFVMVGFIIFTKMPVA